MKLVYDKLLELRSSVSAQNLDGLSLSRLQSLLSASFSTASGAKSNMIARILSRTENGKECNSDFHKPFLTMVFFVRGQIREIWIDIFTLHSNFSLISDCPAFVNKLPKGPGNVCFVHRSCNDLSCAVLLSHANQRLMVTFQIKMDNCLKQLNITTPSTSSVISFVSGTYLNVMLRN